MPTTPTHPLPDALCIHGQYPIACLACSDPRGTVAREPSGRPAGWPETLPDPFDARYHDIRKGRSAKGTPTQRVVSYGTTPRIVGDDPFRPDAGDVVALDGISLAAQADAWIRENDPDAESFPALLGTERRAFAQVIHAGTGAVDAYGVARHTADITDGMAGLPPAIVRESRLRTVYGAETNDHGENVTGGRIGRPEVLAWPVRIRLHGRPRRSDPTDATVPCAVVLTHPVDGTPWMPGTAVALTGWDVDRERLWVGHKLVRRAKTRRATVTTRAARAERARQTSAREVTPEECALRDAWPTTDEPVVVTFPGVTVTMRRQGTGRIVATIVRGDSRPVTVRARTAAPIARTVVA